MPIRQILSSSVFSRTEQFVAACTVQLCNVMRIQMFLLPSSVALEVAVPFTWQYGVWTYTTQNAILAAFERAFCYSLYSPAVFPWGSSSVRGLTVLHRRNCYRQKSSIRLDSRRDKRYLNRTKMTFKHILDDSRLRWQLNKRYVRSSTWTVIGVTKSALMPTCTVCNKATAHDPFVPATNTSPVMLFCFVSFKMNKQGHH
jgi:hypothetical protein